MLKLAQTDRQTNRPTDQQTNKQTNRQGKNNMSPTTIVGDIKIENKNKTVSIAVIL
ncbi:hypothetical protein DPMN_049439 [Dreissena polymorpha]|uniref:Uncharacterized protein n=1 Tax=Dreissena polymorpha TaxID=45954 RepID=A0A9D4CED1_DREPO|nr:hypothetical protein DPMN_049439 [Dreissena polymorpha]